MLDLSSHAEALKSIFERYPAGKYCDECAFAVSMILERGYAVSIMTIKNRETGDLKPFRPPFIQAHLPDGKEFTIGSRGIIKR